MSVFTRLLLAIAAIVFYLLFVVWGQPLEPPPFTIIFRQHFLALVALSMAAALAFILVTLLPSERGNLEFQAFGIKIRGASAPIVLWIICFFVIVVATKLLWVL
jgi:hypothetical protein